MTTTTDTDGRPLHLHPDQQAVALAMRQQGWTFRRIADVLGFDHDYNAEHAVHYGARAAGVATPVQPVPDARIAVRPADLLAGDTLPGGLTVAGIEIMVRIHLADDPGVHVVTDAGQWLPVTPVDPAAVQDRDHVVDLDQHAAAWDATADEWTLWPSRDEAAAYLDGDDLEDL